MAMTQQTDNKVVRKFNIVDAFIIILVVLCVLSVYFRSQIAEWIGIEKNVEEYELSFEISEIRYTSGKYLQAGNAVYLDSGNILLGTIDGNCTLLPAEKYVDGPDGAPVSVIYPKDTYIDVSGKIKCTGFEKEDGFYLDGIYSLAPGNIISVHTEMLNFSMIITEISK